jgi:hypothetical protein
MIYIRFVVEAIDQVRDDLDANDALEELLLTVAETISVNLGLRKKDYRMLFFTPILSDREIEIAGFRLGRQFELVDEGRLNSDVFYSKDLRAIQGCLEQENTELVIPNIPFSDAKTILFARNPGNLRLGLYIAVLKDDFDIGMAEEVFPQVSHIITTLGFMDEMIDFIVQYDQEGGVDDVET